VIELNSVPTLQDPVLLAAFEGWNDAGEAATKAVAHLARTWAAEAVFELDADEYYDFQVNRPRAGLVDGRHKITWPTTRILAATGTPMNRDVVLVQGIEPSVRWRRFAGELLEAADRLGVTTVVTIGALLADVPHTRPIPVSATSDDPDTQARFGAEQSRYEGPTGIVGVLTEAATRAGLPTLSCWAAVPHYAGGAPSPKATLALLSTLERILDVSIPQSTVADDARAWENGVDELAASDSEVADYVKALEQATDTADLPEASGDAIAREFERYLRRRGDDPPSR
jgi:predicted ATP-grasp superfamily ATP-dependent carboligase